MSLNTPLEPLLISSSGQYLVLHGTQFTVVLVQSAPSVPDFLKYCTDGQLINKMEGNGYASYTKSIQLTFHTMHLTQEIWPVSMASGVVR